MDKKLANAGFGTGALTGPLGSFIQLALERLGLVETALWLQGILALNQVNVPEPITLSLFGAGVAGAAAMRRRKKKTA
jgi:PEP-CTERM motif